MAVSSQTFFVCFDVLVGALLSAKPLKLHPNKAGCDLVLIASLSLSLALSSLFVCFCNAPDTFTGLLLAGVVVVNDSLVVDGYMDEADTQVDGLPEEAAGGPLGDCPSDELPNGNGITEPDGHVPEPPSKKPRIIPTVPAFKPSQPDTSHVPQ